MQSTYFYLHIFNHLLCSQLCLERLFPLQLSQLSCCMQHNLQQKKVFELCKKYCARTMKIIIILTEKKINYTIAHHICITLVRALPYSITITISRFFKIHFHIIPPVIYHLFNSNHVYHLKGFNISKNEI